MICFRKLDFSMLAISTYNPRQHQQISFGKIVDIGSALPKRSESLIVEDCEVAPFQFRLERVDGERVSLVNCATESAVIGADEIEANEERIFRLPFGFQCGRTDFHFFDPDQAELYSSVVLSLEESRDHEGRILGPLDNRGRPPSAATLNEWFATLGALQREAANSQAFFDDVATAVVQPGGLDVGMVLLRGEKDWRIQGSNIRTPPIGISFQPRVLENMCDRRSTIFVSSNKVRDAGDIIPKESYVAAPIIDSDKSIVGAIYGCRTLKSGNQRLGVRPLEAQWVRLLAESVSSSLIRFAHEARAAKSRVLLEQTFCKKIAGELVQNPDSILQCRERFVTALFADLRGFTSISEHASASETFELLSEVMDAMTDAVMDRDGVIIDYYGDGLSAMWNAPFDQPNAADLACQAAIEIQRQIEILNQSWESKIGRPLRVGIGIHSGLAQVGNAGSDRRLKYGPRGSTVNLASRLETATKKQGGGILISQSTFDNLATDNVDVERIEPFYVNGFSKPIHACRLLGFSSNAAEKKQLAVHS